MVHIRLATEHDIPLLAGVELSAETAFSVLPDYEPSGRTVDAGLLEKMAVDGKLWVAVGDKNEPVGFIACRNIDDLLYIHEISVAADCQKQGIGRGLMLTVIEQAAKAGYAAIGLTTRRDIVWNGPFYKSLGFVETTDAQRWPHLLRQLQIEIEQGADLALRCAMIKSL